VDFKKNAYWIGLGVVMLVAVVVYEFTVPPVDVLAEDSKVKCANMVEQIHKMAAKSEEPDAIKTAKHEELAGEYRHTIDKECAEVESKLQAWKIDDRFNDVPNSDVQFDSWLKIRYEGLAKKAKDADLQLPADFDKLTFQGVPTQHESKTEDLKPSFRVRRLAIVDEVVDKLCKKPVKLTTVAFQPLPDGKEDAADVDAGALALTELKIVEPPDAAKRIKDSLDKVYYDKGGHAKKTDKSAGGYVEIPYKITCVDLKFSAPLAAVPRILQSLEQTDRFQAVLAKADVKRDSPVFPNPADQSVAAAFAKAPVAKNVNSYYREGPVNVVATFEIYEYDKTKEKAYKQGLEAKEEKDDSKSKSAKK